ncbi:MAG: hypothetical protein H0U03_03830 [Actinobacteria bacterium]|nr:hypothetical protein [Actinomycetota bacterium]
MGTVAPQNSGSAEPKQRVPVHLGLELTLAYALVAGGLITLRAIVDDLDFLSTGVRSIMTLVSSSAARG